MDKELIFEGKKYISARRAAQIYGYTSDYLGQLCRAGSIDGRMVGRSWFVFEDGVVRHKEEAKKTPRGRGNIGRIVSLPVPVPVSNFSNSSNSKSHSHLSFRHSEHEGLEVREHNLASVMRSSTGRSIIAIAIILIVFIVAGPIVSIDQSAQQKSSVALSRSVAFVGGVSDAVLDIFYGTYARVAGGVRSLFAKNNSRTNDDAVQARDGPANPVDNPANKESAGIAVVPSTADEEKDNEIKDYVKHSFSDETRIVPDETGTSGIIQPVFKERNGQDYLFVMVPLRE